MDEVDKDDYQESDKDQVVEWLNGAMMKK